MTLNDSWKELLEDGETSFDVNVYHRMHLLPLGVLMAIKQKHKVKRFSIIGVILWPMLDILQKVTAITSPYAAEVFWFKVEAAWVCKSLKSSPTKWFGKTYHFTRKDNIRTNELGMSFRTYKAVNVIRKHI